MALDALIVSGTAALLNAIPWLRDVGVRDELSLLYAAAWVMIAAGVASFLALQV